MCKLTWSIFSGGMSKIIASLYVGFNVFFFMEVFFFFKRLPSQISDTFTYGSANRAGRCETNFSTYLYSLSSHGLMKGLVICLLTMINVTVPSVWTERWSQALVWKKIKTQTKDHTWITGNIHGFEVPTFDDSKRESPCSWQVAEREHYLSQIHTLLQNQMETLKIQ